MCAFSFDISQSFSDFHVQHYLIRAMPEKPTMKSGPMMRSEIDAMLRLSGVQLDREGLNRLMSYVVHVRNGAYASGCESKLQNSDGSPIRRK